MVALAGFGDAHLDPMARKHDVADRVRNSVEVVEPLLSGFRGQYARIVVVEGESGVITRGVDGRFEGAAVGRVESSGTSPQPSRSACDETGID